MYEDLMIHPVGHLSFFLREDDYLAILGEKITGINLIVPGC